MSLTLSGLPVMQAMISGVHPLLFPSSKLAPLVENDKAHFMIKEKISFQVQVQIKRSGKSDTLHFHLTLKF